LQRSHCERAKKCLWWETPVSVPVGKPRFNAAEPSIQNTVDIPDKADGAAEQLSHFAQLELVVGSLA